MKYLENSLNIRVFSFFLAQSRNTAAVLVAALASEVGTSKSQSTSTASTAFISIPRYMNPLLQDLIVRYINSPTRANVAGARSSCHEFLIPETALMSSDQLTFGQRGWLQPAFTKIFVANPSPRYISMTILKKQVALSKQIQTPTLPVSNNVH